MEYFLDLREILFFETAGTTVAVHTASQIYETHMRLYELEELLHIEAITPWTLLIAAVMVGIALDMLFKGFRKKKGRMRFPKRRSLHHQLCGEWLRWRIG
ncbi:MAG: LytTR family DNA-binding domain-containing protein [Agathobacter sp.]